MKVGDLVRQRFNGRAEDVGLVMNIQRHTHGLGMVDVLWCSDREERKDRRYRMRDLETVSAA